MAIITNVKGSDAGTSLKTMLGNLSPKTKDQYAAFEQLGLMSFDAAKGMEFLKEQGIKPASDSIEDITTALQEYATKQVGAKKYNAEAEEAFKGLGMASGFLNNAFYDTNGNLESMATISGTLKEALTGLTAEQRQQYLYTMFGSDAIRAGNILYKEGAEGITNFKKAMGNVTAEEVAVKKMDNLKGRIEQLKGSFETLQITVGKALEPIAEFGVSALQKLVDGFNNLSPGMQKTIAISTAVAAGLLGIVTAGGVLLAFIGTASLGIGALTSGLGALGIGVAATGTAAAGAAGGVGLLGTAVAALTGPVGIGIASVAALTAGTVLLWKNWDTVQQKFQQNPFLKFMAYANPVTGAILGIVGAGKKIQSMYDEVIPKTNLFSDAVSKSTQKAVGAYMKMDEQASMSLMSMYAKQQTITDQNMATMMSKYDAMTNQVVGKLDSRYKKEYSMAEKLFADTSALSAAEEAKILANMDTWHGQEKAKIEGYQAKIKGIYQKAKDEKRAITESEYRTIQGIQEQMRTSAVQTLSKSEAEQKMILGRLENASGQITARQAAKVIQNSYKQKQESVKHANAQYKETVKNIEYMRDVTGQISAKQAAKLIGDAKHTRDKSIANAEQMHQKVVEEAKAQAGGHGKWIDNETGKVATGWDKMWSKVSSTWDKILGIFGVKSTGKNTHKKGDNTGGYDVNAGGRATGTPNGGHPGGWAITSEQGRELIHEPGKGTYLSGNSGSELRYLRPGSSVLPNHRTEQFLKKYGFDGNKIPGYEEGTGDFFDKIMDGPGAVWDAAAKKVGGLTDNLLPKWFTDATGSITGRIKDAAVGKIQTLIDDFMSSFGDDGGSYTGIGGYYLGSPFRITTRFTPNGNKNDKVHKGGVHKGLDLAAPMGTPIKSLTDGIVQQVLIGSKTAGNGVRIKSGSDLLSYIHMMSAPSVKQGQSVKMGQVIGRVGSTGFSTGPHLDLKIKRNGSYIDPLSYLQGLSGGGAGTTGNYKGQYKAIIKAASGKYGVPGALIAGIIEQESKWNPNARSPVGATGLMQLMPATSRSMGVKNPRNPQQNIMGGTRYISQMLRMFGGDKSLGLAAYNAGPGNVKKYGGIPPFRETQHYVKTVLANYRRFGGSFERGGMITKDSLIRAGEGNKREMIIPLEKHPERAKTLWTQAGEILGMFGKGKKPVMPGQNTGGGTVNNVNNTPEITINLNYSGSASESEVLNMIDLLKKQLKQELIYDMQSYNGKMGYK